MINWKVKNARRETQTGLVTMVNVVLVAEQNGVIVEHEIDVVLPLKNADSPDFVPFEQLTESQVIDWVKQAMKAEGVAHAEADVQVKLQNKTTPAMADGVPWGLDTSKGI